MSTTTTPAPLTADAANKLADSIGQLVTKLNSTPPNRLEGMLNSQQPPGTSQSRGTENKPFSLHRFLSGYKAHNQPEELCPHEFDVVKKYTKAIETTKSGLVNSGVIGGLWLPMDINETWEGQLTSNDAANKDYQYVKAVMGATNPAIDPDELNWLMRRSTNPATREMYVKAGQSAYQDSIGGSLVAPPVQGPVIPLIRPNAAFLAAGATAVTLPPNGKFVAPRVTSAPDVKALGEGQETEIGTLGTGFMELSSKKIGGMVRMTEEASAYTSGTMDVIAQSELGRSLGLRMDAYAFYGVGGNLIPAGLTSPIYAGDGENTGVLRVTTFNPEATGIGANGNTLLPQYGDIFPSLIEERSFGTEDGITGAWVMRPAAYASAVAARASAVTTNDQQGPKVDILRRFDASGPNTFSGRRVVRTTNLLKNREKGDATNLTDVFFGVWRYAFMASYAAINFQQGHNGTTFANGEYLIRGTMFGDIGYQYPEAFLWYEDVAGITGTW